MNYDIYITVDTTTKVDGVNDITQNVDWIVDVTKVSAVRRDALL